MATPQIKYPAAVFGFSADVPVAPALVDYCVASTTVTAGDVVIVDTSNLTQIKPAATNSGTQLIVGVASESATTAGEIVPVVIEGRVSASIATTVTAGDRLSISATDTSQLVAITAATAVTQAKDLGIVVAVAEESVATTVSRTALKVRIVKI